MKESPNEEIGTLKLQMPLCSLKNPPGGDGTPPSSNDPSSKENEKGLSHQDQDLENWPENEANDDAH